jgi:LPXTG-motif cell wall-anchored protein
MIRKLLATATLAMLGLLWLPAMASAAAPAYPAPPVTPESTVPAVVDAVSTAPEISSRTTDTVASLATTGAGFNVGLTVWIGVAVLVVGVGLLLAGRRSRKSGAQG